MELQAKTFHFSDKIRIASIVPQIQSINFRYHQPMLKIQKIIPLTFGLRFSGFPERTKSLVDGVIHESCYPSVIIKRPGELWQCDPHHWANLFYICYDPGTLGYFQRHGLPDDLREMEMTDLDAFTPLVEQFRDLLKSSEEFGMADRIDLLGFRLFAEIILQWKKMNSPIGQMDQRIFQAASYLRFHFLEDIDFARLAKKFGFSYRTFLRRWQEAGYQPPAAMLFELRMEEARRLLAETDLPISEIASRLQYGSSGWFSTVFRQTNGVNALAYRKSSRLAERE